LYEVVLGWLRIEEGSGGDIYVPAKKDDLTCYTQGQFRSVFETDRDSAILEPFEKECTQESIYINLIYLYYPNQYPSSARKETQWESS
jgi:hypothetical protein